MPSQGSATHADGPTHGDTSSYPSMADRTEIERGRVGRVGRVVRVGRVGRGEQSNQEGEEVL